MKVAVLPFNLWVSFPGCPKADSVPKVPWRGASCDQKCAAQLLQGHRVVRIGSQNWMVSTPWSVVPWCLTEKRFLLSFVSVWDWAQQVASTSSSHHGYSLKLKIPVSSSFVIILITSYYLQIVVFHCIVTWWANDRKMTCKSMELGFMIIPATQSGLFPMQIARRIKK